MKAGVPNGVFNVITRFGKAAGAAINHHMDIDKAATKSDLKHVSLEIRGKSPLVIFYDADINLAVDLALLGILFNKGLGGGRGGGSAPWEGGGDG
ncbi:hypothetical protein C1H46_001704 [Malus baccata]|uniref:Aldehyde dehydrogenase domain-containing protein n=1 Tax=Malus baccata TaxID=106549 RepID=A0A540NNR8_MALBA|nr:hypothetical protein C1H46_001704 [Malus baccata]